MSEISVSKRGLSLHLASLIEKRLAKWLARYNEVLVKLDKEA